MLPLLPAAAPAAADDGTGAPLPAERAAAAEARSTGQRVEVEADRTEYDTTYADPDGTSFTLEQSAVPVRVRTGEGAWTAPDTTLVRRSDGTVGPKAAVVRLSFSGGGDGAGLVDIGHDGRSLALGWSGTLPEPVLDGANATYPDVLPDVDLRLTATTEGFRELLVVRTPKAAADPALARVEFSVRADGLAVRQADGGGMTAVDSDTAAPVFSAPAALMWDSSGPGTAEGATAATAKASAATPRAAARAAAAGTDGDATPTASAPAGAADPAADDPTTGPGDGDASAVLPVKVDADSLAVVPDAAMLARTDAAAYPLYIDPTVGLSQTARTQIRSDGATDFEFTNGTNNEGKGVGHCSSYAGYYCGTGYTERIYYQFAPTTLAGKKVLDATFRDTESWSFTCDASWVDVERTSNISSATTWAGRPSNLGTVASRDVSAGRGSECSPSQPAAPVEFHDSRLTTQVSDFAAGRFSRLTLLLKARDESATSDWKRFRDDAVLSVTYVGLPAVPTSAGLVSGSGVTCETSASDPQITGDATPDFTAKVAAVSGGGSGAQLRAYFYVEKQAGDGSWAVATEPVRPLSGYLSSGTTETDPSPITLAENSLYRLAVFTRSYYDGGYVQSHSTLTTKGWCYFKIDKTAPKPPVVTVGSPYSVCTADACAAAGGPGTPGTFSFGPASGDTNTAYEYKLASSPAWSAAIKGNSVQAKITPQLAGTQLLLVRGQDAAGWGQTQTVKFNVQEGQGPIGRWHFDDAAPGSGVVTAADTATEGTRHPATLYTAGTGWSSFARTGSGDRSLWLNDTSVTANQQGYAATSQPVVNTESSFTVSAWAYLTDESAFRTVLSETGSDSSGFSLYYSPNIQRWVFLWNWQEGGARKYLGANGTAGVPLKTWTHLTGVYDSEAGTLGLYVNGRLQGAPVTLPAAAAAHAADGLLEFGRNSSTYGVFDNYMRGRDDEVAVWQRALTPDEIATEDRLPDADGAPAVALAADWNPDGATGTVLNDTTSPYARSLALSGGASLDGSSLVLDGGSGAATAAGPVVDGTASFTVTATADPDPAALAKKPVGTTVQIAGQRSADGSSWGFWYKVAGTETVPDPDGGDDLTVPVGTWYFGRLTADGNFDGVVSDEPADLGSPVRLTGTYDGPSAAVHFYLGDSENGADAVHPYTADAGSGLFTVGEAQAAGETGWGHWMPGRIDDLRLWVGAMNDSQVGALDGD
ncbi:LamG domain-containing protein [Streptomyces sp. NPDC090306]|uniref:LamG domain-containing protein n=1 Tax=Streptomyces sp. NPDC090306 TaxID=3365961 RepID=UPI00380414DC